MVLDNWVYPKLSHLVCDAFYLVSNAVANVANIAGLVVIKMPLKICDISYVLSDGAKFDGFEGNCLTRGRKCGVHCQHVNDTNGGKVIRGNIVLRITQIEHQ